MFQKGTCSLILIICILPYISLEIQLLLKMSLKFLEMNVIHFFFQITFPGHYTNTCCSHPLHTPHEIVEENALGVKVAAQRRLNFELGIPPEETTPKDFTYLTRIHYASPSDGMWGEHEMDYILFLQKDVSITPNENEVQEVRYVKQEDFSEFLKELQRKNIPITPWFDLIAHKILPLWWKNLDNLKNFMDHKNIHRW